MASSQDALGHFATLSLGEEIRLRTWDGDVYMTVTGLKPPLMATRIFAECATVAVVVTGTAFATRHHRCSIVCGMWGQVERDADGQD